MSRKSHRAHKRTAASPLPDASDERMLLVAHQAFALLWSLAILFDFLQQWVMRPTVPSPDKYSMAVAIALAIWLILRPASVLRLAALAAAVSVAIFIKMPQINNHEVFIFFLSVGSLAAIGEQSWRQRGVATPTSVYRQFAPAAAASLLVLYFWATVHKFNTGYFDKNLSCATMQLFNLHTKSVFGMKLAFVPTGDAARYFAIYGTLIVETAIPVLLALRPTRLAGVALAMGFHFVLGFSYPAFSSLIYALLPLFLPTSFWRALIAWWDRCWLHRVVRDVTTWKQVRWGLQLLFVLLVCFALPFRFEGLVPAESKLQMRYTCWLLYGTIMLWLFVRQLPQSSTERSSFPHVLLPPRSVLGVVLPALLFLNGIAPHIGLKSTQSFAMYSNLRAEGGTSNHLFIPAGWQIFDAQRDLVTILHSSDPLLRDLSRANWHGHRSNMRFGTYILRADVVRDDGRQAPRWQFPYVSLRQRIDDLARAGSTGIWLTFTRDGVEHHVVNAETDPELGQLSFWERKFYRMRAVPDIEEGCCMW